MAEVVIGAAITAAAGAAGVGKKEIDEKQDDENWKRMDLLEKAESGLARSIESVGSFVFLDNMANEARSQRIKNETDYFAKQGLKPTQETAPLKPTQRTPTNTQVGRTISGILGGGLADLADMVSKGEGDYTSYNAGTKGVANGKVKYSGKKDLSGMTINEIMANANSKDGNDKDRLFAVGLYHHLTIII